MKTLQNKKTAQMRTDSELPDMIANIRVNKKKWQRFQLATKTNESDASKEVRKFINKYLSENERSGMKENED